MLTDLKESHGDLVAYWQIEGSDPLALEAEAEIERLIDTADRCIKALRHHDGGAPRASRADWTL